ncbi:STY4526/YPO1902 family pathogenicity island replication protein [Oceanicoccus sp. KOV_DT_Chl]|uniref:STY4526/YPO1902 family pathogenicity island replication protein n=1 Tax=Oceanicoccus sp. KOV_DT_Chl TaxID=1904639 RepID=UPI000C7DCDC9|nr:STY4526/YPO1902 family pathogenicity island replication protein [Oceanicoccus sp. KOV_DT_Chl]
MSNVEEAMSRSVARTLMSSLETLQSIHFNKNSLPDNLITFMSKLNLTEQTSLIQSARHYVAININIPALERQIQALENKREEKELEDIYLLQGAPLILMRRLFGMHASEFSRRRNILNIRGVGSGRPPLCNEESEHQVWKLWQHNNPLNERERFLKIADETNLDLHLIWGALRAHIDS